MAKNKTNNNKPDRAAQAGRGQGQNVLVQLAVSGAVLGLVVTLAAFLVLGLWQLPSVNQSLLAGAAGRIAEAQASAVDLGLRRLQARLAQIADPELTAVLEQRDTAGIAVWQTRMKRWFPEAASVRVLPLGPLGIAGLRREEAGLRNNIEMDLVRRASAALAQWATIRAWKARSPCSSTASIARAPARA